MNEYFARLGIYLKFICRRERFISAIWVACITGIAVSFAGMYPDLLPTQTEAIQLAMTMSNPAMVSMMGNVYGMENLTQASVMAQECLVWFLVGAAIMNIFLINRHTRVDEEAGRLEMFRALPVGRLTGTLATIKFAFFVNLIISVFTALFLIALNLGGTTVAGAFVYGFAIGVVGFVFAGLTLLLAQLFSTAHGVSGAGFALLGLFYIMRAVGDVRDNALSYISPLGLGLKVEAFYSDAIAPIVILLIEGFVLSIAALAICAVRDHGMGIIPAKKGRAVASRFLCSPFGFAWRLTQGSFLGWGAGLFLLGAAFGSVCSDINSFVEGNEMVIQVIGTNVAELILDSYVAMIFVIISIVASAPVVSTIMKIHTEEKRGRLDQIIARAVPRTKLYVAFIAVAIIQSVAMEILLAVGLGSASGGQLPVWEMIKIGLIYLPAIWAMAGFTVLLIGFIPKLSVLVWAIFGYTFIVLYMGRVMNLPEWAGKITPFGNIPQLPVQDFTIVPLLVLTLISVVLTGSGILLFKERDIG